MPMDERQAEWLAWVAEHKSLARLLRADRLRGDDRARFDALTRLLLDAMPGRDGQPWRSRKS